MLFSQICYNSVVKKKLTLYQNIKFIKIYRLVKKKYHLLLENCFSMEICMIIISYIDIDKYDYMPLYIDDYIYTSFYMKNINSCNYLIKYSKDGIIGLLIESDIEIDDSTNKLNLVLVHNYTKNKSNILENKVRQFKSTIQENILIDNLLEHKRSDKVINNNTSNQIIQVLFKGNYSKITLKEYNNIDTINLLKTNIKLIYNYIFRLYLYINYN